jgi:hypothetical protein
MIYRAIGPANRIHCGEMAQKPYRKGTVFASFQPEARAVG